MIQDCFITALMQETSFRFDTPLKNDSFLLNVSQTNIVHFYEPEVLSNMISSSTTTLCVCGFYVQVYRTQLSKPKFLNLGKRKKIRKVLLTKSFILN